jgi:hypothetical protein
MPDAALPIPRDAGLTGTVPLRREYRDVLGRPLAGSATVTGSTRLEDGDTVVPPVSVTVDIPAGVLELYLPPDIYTVVATLRTRDRQVFTDTDTVTLEARP